MSGSYEEILYDVRNYVATIAINRPQSLNALTARTLEELEDAIQVAGTDRNVGVVILTGVGDRAFCAGGDMKWEAAGGLVDLDYRIDRLLCECPKPVIARVNGYAIASGNHIAYYCDLTIAAEHAIFGQNGPRVGSPAGGRIVSHLAAIIGHKRAREMWMLCRRYSAKEMLDWGLVNAVVPYGELDAEVDRWAKELLALSPTCLRIVKRSFVQTMDRTEQRMVLDEVARGYFETGEQQEGAAAFLEKRPPDFGRWR
jgi:2-ketocyclohexanecarboxyl-CoA hydrolase